MKIDHDKYRYPGAPAGRKYDHRIGKNALVIPERASSSSSRRAGKITRVTDALQEKLGIELLRGSLITLDGQVYRVGNFVGDKVELWRETTASRHESGQNPGTMRGIHDRPMAARGLKSYRYRGGYGWIMIGAKDERDALREASRSTGGKTSREHLQAWNESRDEYVPVTSGSASRHESGQNPRVVGKTDEAVIRAFLERRAMEGRKLTTDGKRLDGGAFQHGIAHWHGDVIIEPDLGSKRVQSIQHKMRRMAPRHQVFAHSEAHAKSQTLARHEHGHNPKVAIPKPLKKRVDALVGRGRRRTT